MILFLFSEADLNINDASFKHVRLATLLTDLCTGFIAKENKLPVFRDAIKSPSVEKPVALLRQGHFNRETNEIDWKVIKDDLDERSKSTEKSKVERRLIIEPDDLLLSLKGRKRVIQIDAEKLDSMPEDLANKGLRLAPSNNFILMRPHKQLIEVSYLKMFIELMIADAPGHQENNQKEKIITDMGFSLASDSISGTRELREWMIHYPDEIKDQKSLVEKYQKIVEKEKEIMIEKRIFCNNLSYLTTKMYNND